MKTITAKQIHAAFDAASDLLLEEAERKRGGREPGAVERIKKAERLKRLGFVDSEEVIAAKAIIRLQYDRELAPYYRKKYPFLRFITEEQLNRICDKYDLVYSDVTDYTGVIPMKNLEEMENARIKPEDYIEKPEEPKRIKALEIALETEKRTTDNPDVKISILEESNALKGDYIQAYAQYLLRKYTLFIVVAPESFFKPFRQTGDEFHTKDPIVFRWVRGGLLIITKWGGEASAPEPTIPLLS
jgi:hypothetical protein